MIGLTINPANSALDQARSVWFQSGLEDLRGGAIDWLEKPDSNIPEIFNKIAQNIGISIRTAVSIGKLIEDQKTAVYLEQSREFQTMPLTALEIFQKAQELYKSRVKNPNSSGAADVKVMHGQWRGDKYKPGLITKFNDYFVAHMAYYMAIGGWTAVREVRRATDWSLDRLKDLLLIAIREINWIKKTIGLRVINALSKTMHRGMHFFSSVFTVLNVKLKAKDKAKDDVQSAARGEDVVADGEEDITDVAFALEPHNNPDPEDPDPDDDPGARDLTVKPYKDVFDDPDRAADPPDPDKEPRAKLKTGRELAFTMIAAAKKAASGNQRYRQLMETIDDQKLVSALQKDSKDYHEIAERMTTFLSCCWQWAERTGIFSEKEHRHLLDSPPEPVVKLITHATQGGYWETGNNKQQDVPKTWKDVMHKDDLGRDKLARLTRPCSLDIKTKPHIVNGLLDGRTVILNPGPELRAYFFQHLKKAPAAENLRYFIISDGTTETIMCQQQIHPRKSPVDNNTMPLNDEFEAPDENGDIINALDLEDKSMAMVAQALGISPDLLTAARFGDERALAVVLKAASGMDEDQRDDLMDALMPH
ncbi:hypothetical protein [Acidithiobacillus sp.]